MRSFVAGLIALIVTPSLSLGWGDLGHQVVAEIASRHLSEKAAAQIQQLLGPGTHVMADFAMWADDIAEERPETDPWHVVDIPHDGEYYDRERDCPDDDCIVEKIKQFAQVIGDPQLPRAARAEAVKFLIHLVGDLHMPFHAHAPHSTWGGWEGPWIQIGETADLLHVWWEWVIVAELGSSFSQIVDTLVTQISDDEQKEWMRGTAGDWANESFRIAREFITAYGLDNAARWNQDSEAPPVDLPPVVADQAKSIVAERLKMAGVRLAWLLNRAFE